jgi:CubicO group peptidase (beta-lactamase class C family)
MALTKELTPLLRRAIKRHQVPGASIAILKNDRIMTTAAAGVCSVETKVPVTDDTVFQIGSITKPHTATLVMQLVDEGKLDLDAPIQHYLPNFRVADFEVSRKVTARQFLSHQSGIDGDFFVDSGRGDDSTERLLEMGRMLPSLYPLGTALSYCNFGFVVLGRVVEVLTGRTWDEAMQERIFEPLGMEHAFTLPEMAIRFRCANGHVPSQSKKGTWNASRIPYLSIGQKAAGSTPSMTATDLLTFAQMHLNRGKNSNDEKVLTARSVDSMQKRQIRVPGPGDRSYWGLGWMLFDWDGHKVYGHDGGTIGQASFLRILPEKNVAVALLTNGGDAQGLSQEVLGHVFHELARIGPPGVPDYQPDLKIDFDRLEGTYENMNLLLDFKEVRGKFTVSGRTKDWPSDAIPEKTELGFVDKETARLRTGNKIADRALFTFTEVSDGKAGLVAYGTRQYRRAS